jgi:hypothetical protein
MAYLIKAYDVPPALTLNSDQTGVPLTPCSNYTRAKKGAKEVSATGYGDKRQITATPTTAADGTMLPLQVSHSYNRLFSVPALASALEAI